MSQEDQEVLQPQTEWQEPDYSELASLGDSLSVPPELLEKWQNMPRRWSPEGFEPEDYDPDVDDYAFMRENGFSHAEIREYLGPRLAACGLTDRQISDYFNEQAVPTWARVWEHGWQGSWLGMKSSGRLPEDMEPEELESIGFLQRQAMGLATIAGDIPPMVAGGVMGFASAGGTPAAAITIPMGAFGMAEGMKAQARDEIINGPDFKSVEDFLQRTEEVAGATLKGTGIGAATATGGAASRWWIVGATPCTPTSLPKA